MYRFTLRSDPMNAASHHSPVILLLGTRSASSDPFDQWLEKSPYRAWAASDVFQLLDQLSDFTIRNRPDVVFLHIGSTVEERALTLSLIQAGMADASVPVIDLVTESCNFDDTILSLANQLDHFIPQHDAAAS